VSRFPAVANILGCTLVCFPRGPWLNGRADFWSNCRAPLLGGASTHRLGGRRGSKEDFVREVEGFDETRDFRRARPWTTKGDKEAILSAIRGWGGTVV